MLTIPTFHKFASLSMLARLRSIPTSEAIAVNNNAFVCFSNPFVLDQMWVADIGQLRANEFNRGNLVLMVHSKCKNRDVLDEENHKLCDEVSLIYYLLALFGLDIIKPSILISGTAGEKKCDVRSVGTLEPYYRIPSESTFSFDMQSNELIGRAFDNLKVIYGAGTLITRFKKGFACMISAPTLQFAADQLHEYVRAMEAVVCSSKRVEFARRLATLICSDEKLIEAEQLLQELYKTRGLVEHMNPFKDSRDIFRQTIMSRIIARHLYKTILTDDHIVKYFTNDTALKQFWKNLPSDCSLFKMDWKGLVEQVEIDIDLLSRLPEFKGQLT